MLPSYYRLKARNDGGVTATVTVNWQPYKVIGGTITYGTAAALTNLSAASVASATSATSPTIDNTSDKMHGGFATFTVNPGSTPTGNQTWLLYLEKSNDDSVFGSQDEHFVGSLLLTATGAASAAFEVRP
jgi:hypothetical protein